MTSSAAQVVHSHGHLLLVGKHGIVGLQVVLFKQLLAVGDLDVELMTKCDRLARGLAPMMGSDAPRGYPCRTTKGARVRT